MTKRKQTGLTKIAEIAARHAAENAAMAARRDELVSRDVEEVKRLAGFLRSEIVGSDAALHHRRMLARDTPKTLAAVLRLWHPELRVEWEKADVLGDKQAEANYNTLLRLLIARYI